MENLLADYDDKADWHPADRGALTTLKRRVWRAVEGLTDRESSDWIVEETLYQVVDALRKERRVHLPEIGEIAVTHGVDGTARAVIVRATDRLLAELRSRPAPYNAPRTLISVPADVPADRLATAFYHADMCLSGVRGRDNLLYADPVAPPGGGQA